MRNTSPPVSLCLRIVLGSFLLLVTPTSVTGMTDADFRIPELLLDETPPENATISFDNKTYITCGDKSDCIRLNGHERVECEFHTTSNKTKIKLCRCFNAAGLTPPGDCVEANCTFGPRSCMNTNINAPLGLAAYTLTLVVAGKLLLPK